MRYGQLDECQKKLKERGAIWKEARKIEGPSISLTSSQTESRKHIQKKKHYKTTYNKPVFLLSSTNEIPETKAYVAERNKEKNAGWRGEKEHF